MEKRFGLINFEKKKCQQIIKINLLSRELPTQVKKKEKGYISKNIMEQDWASLFENGFKALMKKYHFEEDAEEQELLKLTVELLKQKPSGDLLFRYIYIVII